MRCALKRNAGQLALADVDVDVDVEVDGDGDGDVAVGGSPTQLREHRHDALKELAPALLHPCVDDLQHGQRVQDSGPLHGRTARNRVGARKLSIGIV